VIRPAIQDVSRLVPSEICRPNDGYHETDNRLPQYNSQYLNNIHSARPQSRYPDQDLQKLEEKIQEVRKFNYN